MTLEEVAKLLCNVAEENGVEVMMLVYDPNLPDDEYNIYLETVCADDSKGPIETMANIVSEIMTGQAGLTPLGPVSGADVH